MTFARIRSPVPGRDGNEDESEETIEGIGVKNTVEINGSNETRATRGESHSPVAVIFVAETWAGEGPTEPCCSMRLLQPETLSLGAVTCPQPRVSVPEPGKYVGPPPVSAPREWALGGWGLSPQSLMDTKSVTVPGIQQVPNKPGHYFHC